jgi:hypothetical protein
MLGYAALLLTASIATAPEVGNTLPSPQVGRQENERHADKQQRRGHG